MEEGSDGEIDNSMTTVCSILQKMLEKACTVLHRMAHAAILKAPHRERKGAGAQA